MQAVVDEAPVEVISNLSKPIPNRCPRDFSGLRVLIFGLGRFGGGVGAARFFAERGADVTVTDQAPSSTLQASLEQLADVPISCYQLGSHRAEDFVRADWVVVNPAIPPTARFLQVAQESGATLVTEIDLFLRWCPSPHTIGITGTNGKSTIAQLTANMIEASGHTVELGGNIGRSLLPEIDAISPETRIVLELSSFQLERLSAETPRPAAVAITHFAPNHLDWHGDEESYRRAKENILGGPITHPTPWVVLPAHSPHFARWGDLARPRRIVPFSGADFPEHGCGVDDGWLTVLDRSGRLDSFFNLRDCPLRGEANHHNVACATALAMPMVIGKTSGGSAQGIVTALRNFKALTHRQELVGSSGGVDFINDSKATTPEATRSALQAFGPRAILLAGGSSKGVPFESWTQIAEDNAVRVIVYGETAPEIEEALNKVGFPTDRRQRAETLESAFEAAVAKATAGDIVLLSPSCASFDQFVNYEARGDAFRELAQSWCQSRSH